MRDIDSSQKQFWGSGGIFRSYNHPIMEYFTQQRIRFIQKYIPLYNVHSVLDIGCGNGSTAYYFSRMITFTVAGDYAIDWRGYPHQSFDSLYFNAYQLPFKTNQFDMVYMWEVLHHLVDIEQAIHETIRVSKKFVLIMEPNPINPVQYLYSYAEKNHFLIRQCTRKRILTALRKNGCKKVLFKRG